MAGNAGNVGDRGIARSTVSPVQEMSAFDELPADVRAVLRDATLEWPSVVMLAKIRGGANKAGLIARVRDYEARRKTTP